jgi:hypothetical protein
MDLSGGSVSNVGDVYNDGVDNDIIIGAPFASPEGKTNAGEAYAVFGEGDPSQPFPAAVELFEINGSNGFVLRGTDADDLTGHVTRIGDVNGDLIDDILIDATGATPKATTIS